MANKVYIPELLKRSFKTVYAKKFAWYYKTSLPKRAKTYVQDLKKGKIDIRATIFLVIVPPIAPILLIFSTILERRRYKDIVKKFPKTYQRISLEEK